MANQIEATIYLPEGNAPVTLSFNTGLIKIEQSFGSGTINSLIYFYSENDGFIVYKCSDTVSALLTAANTNGTSMVEATVVKINGQAYSQSTTILFPKGGCLIKVSTGASGINSEIKFKGDSYYAEETQGEIVTAANAGGGNSSFLTNSVTLNNIDIKNLPTIPFELIPAPGADKAIHIIDAYAVTNFTVGYSGITGASLNILFANGAYANNIYSAWEAALSTLGYYYQQFTPNYFSIGTGDFDGEIVSNGLISGNNWVNAPVLLKDDWNGVSNYGGGDPANTMKVVVHYEIVET